MENKIKEVRTEYGLTQKELGEIYNIPLRTIENWEAGKETPPDEVTKLLVQDIPNVVELFAVIENDHGHETVIWTGTKKTCKEVEEETRRTYKDRMVKDCFVEHLIIRHRAIEKKNAWKKYISKIPQKDQRIEERDGKRYSLDYADFLEWYEKEYMEDKNGID